MQELELYAQSPLHQRPQAEVRLLRRRHAVLSLGHAAHVADRSHEGAAAVGRGGGGHLRGRARHAHRAEAHRAPRDRRHAPVASASRTSTRTSWRSTAARIARTRSTAPTTSRAPSASRRSTSTSSPAWSTRRTTTGARTSRKTDRARAGQRDDLPDGGAVQHGHLQDR